MGANKGQKEAAKLQAQMAAESLRLQKLQLSQPKVTPSDNFMANKLKTLRSLRMGIASTINPTVRSAVAPASNKTQLGV